MEYDNTNRGAAFPPRPEQNMILTGKMNVEGTEGQVVMVKDTDHKGEPIISIYERVGLLYPNKDKAGKNDPDYTGPVKHMRVAGWKEKSKDGLDYLSMKVSEKQASGSRQPEQQPAVTEELDDVIPF
jgi:uncharacterized protein (DUF736 family)